MSRRSLMLWTDGAATERAGRPGGWAYIAVLDEAELSSATGSSPATTCVLMELEAVRQALLATREHGWHTEHAIELVSDSAIALDACTGRFFPRPYESVARELFALTSGLGVVTRKVRAHSGLRWNELADERARLARDLVWARSRFQG